MEQPMINKKRTRLGAALAALASSMYAFNSMVWALAPQASGFEVYSWRILFAFLTVSLCVLFSKTAREGIKEIFSSKKLTWLSIGFGIAMVVRMLGYFTLVMHKDLYIDLSFASFVCPLIQVPVASLILREKLSKASVIALILALISTVYLAIAKNTFPVMAIIFGLSSATYAGLKKQVKKPILSVLWIEYLCAIPFIIAIFTFLGINGEIAFFSYSNVTLFITLGSFISLTTYVINTFAVQNASGAAFGFAGYLEPSVLLLIGLFLYKNPLDVQQLIAFIIVWMALLVYTVSNYISYKKQQRLAKTNN